MKRLLLCSLMAPAPAPAARPKPDLGNVWNWPAPHLPPFAPPPMPAAWAAFPATVRRLYPSPLEELAARPYEPTPKPERP